MCNPSGRSRYARRFCPVLQQQNKLVRVSRVRIERNWREFPRKSTFYEVAVSPFSFSPFSNWYNWLTAAAFAQCHRYSAIAAARNDNTRRSFGLIKGIVRQMLPSLPPSTTPVSCIANSALIPISKQHMHMRGTYALLNGATRLCSVMIRHFALATARHVK